MSSELTGEKSAGVTEETDGHFSKTVTLKQETAGWQTEPGKSENLTEAADATDPASKGTAKITSTTTGATINIKMSKMAKSSS